MEMQEDIFRKKSLDKLRSPENLDECIKVTDPAVWLILAAVILLLAGACIWGAFGHIDSIVPVSVHAEGGTLTGTIEKEYVTSVKPGMTVRFAGQEAVVRSLSFTDDGYVCTLSAESSVPDGFYDGKIVIQSFRPLSFILN